MSTHELPAIVLALGLGSGAAFSAGPNLGTPLEPAEIAAWDISIQPDGTGLPPGGGTPAEGDRQLLGLFHDRLRFHPAGDALAATALAHRQRSLCAHRLYPRAEQADRRERLDERRNAPQGAHAQPRRIHHPFSRQDLIERSRSHRADPVAAA